LWLSDGTNSGTNLIGDLNPGIYASLISMPWFCQVNGTLYFAADNGTLGNELYKYDGTQNSVNDFIKMNTHFVYPNPSNHIISVNSSEKLQYAEVFDLTGNRIITTREVNIDITSLSPGIYILKSYFNDGQFQQKFIKE